MKILDRYILKEVFYPFLFGVVLFTILFISADLLFRIAKMLVEGSASLQIAWSFLVNSLPQILVLTLPMAVMLACLLAFGRLSGESELVAMRAGGIGFPRIIIAALFFALGVSLASLYLNNYIAPEANYQATNILIRYLYRSERMGRENMVLKDKAPDGSERLLYIRLLDDQRGIMKDVFIHYFKDGKRQREIFADEAKWEGSTWHLTKPRTIEFAEDQTFKYEWVSEQAELAMLASPEQLSRRERNKEELSLPALKEKLKKFREVKEKGVASREYYELLVFYYQKFAIPFTCLTFSLFGVPLGIRPHRTGTSIGLGLSLVFIFVFYLLMTLGTTLGVQGVLPAQVAAWFPNLVFAGVGVVMIGILSKT